MAGWLTGWLNGTGSLDSPGQLGFGTHFFCFPGLLVFESGASALGRDTGHTLDPLWAQDLSLAAPGPGWLAGRLAGRAAEAAGWVADWLAEWLAVCLLGLSWTARLWDPLFFFPGWAFVFTQIKKTINRTVPYIYIYSFFLTLRRPRLVNKSRVEYWIRGYVHHQPTKNMPCRVRLGMRGTCTDK